MSEENLPVNMNRDFKGIWIPRKLIETLKSKWNLIFRICETYYFGKPLCNEDWKFLLKLGLAEKRIFTPNELKIFISTKSPQKILGIPANFKCEWCEGNTYRLHCHHYPIPKKYGGTCIVKICAQCHDEYHFLSECFYSFTDLVYSWFKEGDSE